MQLLTTSVSAVHRGFLFCTKKLLITCTAVMLLSTGVIAQEKSSPQPEQTPAQTPQQTVDIERLSERLDDVAIILSEKLKARESIADSLEGVAVDSMMDEREKLDQLNREISSLRETFELVALGPLDIATTVDEATDYDWRQELIEVVAPLLDSLKSLTRKPRQLSELRETIEVNTARLAVANNALSLFENLSASGMEPEGLDGVSDLVDKWENEQQTYEQQLLVASSQLERLESAEQSTFAGIWPATRNFLLGRGLTLVLAAAAAAVSWLFMRFLWWVYSRHLTTKKQRRGSLWFRLLEYSFYILTAFVVLFVVLGVLYVREDLLLLALAVVLIAAAALSLRQFVPAYVKEARLLLNLGPVREDESVMYAGLPWQVMSLNIQTVLRNPALEGVLRLPLESVSTLTSRPIKEDTLWFPTLEDDYIILPDGSFGHVSRQTPELVQVRVKGGMIQTWRTADFYSMNILNLSRGESYGVAVTFGFDYALQDISLTEVPQALNVALEAAFETAGLKEGVLHLLVDLQSAGASSIDYLIYVTMDSQYAEKYYGIQRLVNRTCVSVANERGWNIPFPQMVVHHQPI